MAYKKKSITFAIVFLLGLGLLASFVGQALAQSFTEYALSQGLIIPPLALDQRAPGSLSIIANDHGAGVSALAPPTTCPNCPP